MSKECIEPGKTNGKDCTCKCAYEDERVVDKRNFRGGFYYSYLLKRTRTGGTWDGKTYKCLQCGHIQKSIPEAAKNGLARYFIISGGMR